mmetsp:Transcript_138167/g.240246  ORF Transcript_138167/g.240246 Transcript_138167/m.240246 type:complete len:293 (-) Transcript_138167:275-1153(-)
MLRGDEPLLSRSQTVKIPVRIVVAWRDETNVTLALTSGVHILVVIPTVEHLPVGGNESSISGLQPILVPVVGIVLPFVQLNSGRRLGLGSAGNLGRDESLLPRPLTVAIHVVTIICDSQEAVILGLLAVRIHKVLVDALLERFSGSGPHPSLGVPNNLWWDESTLPSLLAGLVNVVLVVGVLRQPLEVLGCDILSLGTPATAVERWEEAPLPGPLAVDVPEILIVFGLVQGLGRRRRLSSLPSTRTGAGGGWRPEAFLADVQSILIAEVLVISAFIHLRQLPGGRPSHETVP